MNTKALEQLNTMITDQLNAEMEKEPWKKEAVEKLKELATAAAGPLRAYVEEGWRIAARTREMTYEAMEEQQDGLTVELQKDLLRRVAISGNVGYTDAAVNAVLAMLEAEAGLI